MSGASCGDERPAPAEVGSPTASGTPLGAELDGARPCIEGAVEACSVKLGEHAGVISCLEGTRRCENGQFGACTGDRVFNVAATSTDGEATGTLQPLAFSAPQSCRNNPCNSYCREFDEVPPQGISADVDPSAPALPTWPTGNLADYPPEWVAVGNREPCQDAADCQFNTACTDPSFGSCSHSVCSEGEALLGGCNRCADTVCAADPSCCGSSFACTHDPCDGSGAPLDPSCDSCVASVCAVHPECCTTTWDAACVGYVATECAPLGQTCGCPEGSVALNGSCYALGDVPRDFGLARDACSTFGSGWHLTQVDSAEENASLASLIAARGIGAAWIGASETAVDQWTWHSTGEVFFISNASGGELQPGYDYQNFGPGEPALGQVGLAVMMADSGEWRGEAQITELDYLCEGSANTLTPRRSEQRWSDSCVALAVSACGVECPSSAPLGLGTCTARVASDLDASCAAFDLALGATCATGSGAPVIPVCNHGQSPAPAGLRLAHLPATELGKAAPDMSLAVDCTLSEAIPAGRCVAVSDCPGLTADRALVVNPIDGGENTDECRFSDNWTIYQPVTCGTPVCESGVYDAARTATAEDCAVPVENPLGLDTSLATVTVEGALFEPRCGSDEARWGNSCYFFSREVATWDEAQERCQSRGAGWDLVALNSPAENTWVRGETDENLDVQIGLNDKASEGDHVWSNGSCRAFTNWDLATAQPNNVPLGSEQCARMTADSGDAWEDTTCNDDAHPFVCEGPLRSAQGSCAAGQVMGPDGFCYLFDAAPSGYGSARTSCAALGPGWDLASIDDASTNDFVSGLVGCTETWLDNPPGALARWAAGLSVDLTNPPYMDATGFWRVALDDEDKRAKLCRGPAPAPSPRVLDRVSDASACASADQYYFEGSSAAPEAVRLCPAACESAASDGGRITIDIPCAETLAPVLETTAEPIYYEAECDTPGVVWDFFYYDAITPADSRIEFSVRTASSMDQLTANTLPFVPVATAQAVPVDTQRCEVDPPSCPIDLFNLLGNPAQQLPFLELRVHLVPGSNGEGPLLRDWKVRYSCPPSQ